MKFLTVRDLRNKSARVWKDLAEEREMVITNNGRPIAILSSIDENNLETSLKSIRRARLVEAISSVQYDSVKKGKDKITADEINREIEAVRKNRKK
jgi:antitoxin (DNA-binding transcriptional repressor) of toxin-antitoxin stability system